MTRTPTSRTPTSRTPTSRITVVGDVLLDRDLLGDVRRVSPDAPVPVLDLRQTRERPGGAGLAAALLAAPDRAVTLVTCAAPDDAGATVRRLLAAPEAPVTMAPAGRIAATRSVTRVRSAGQALVRIDAAGDDLPARASLDLPVLTRALADADAVLVSDYGGGFAAHPQVRAALRRAARHRPLVWDPHPRGPSPVPGTTVVTPNRSEVRRAAERLGLGTAAPDEHLDRVAAALRERWQVRAVAATDGATGVFTALAGSPPLFTPAPFTHLGDPCGAGDRFAGALAAALAAGAVITEAVAAAVEETAAWLAGGGVESLSPTHPRDRAIGGDQAIRAEAPALHLARTVHAAGGTVVATGGCFDIVHAGHVASLQAARRLGDCLVVLLNSDDAVRRLKGPDRPVHRVEDRIAVLRGLECVDAVMVFDDVTPVAALQTLRPDVWAKGGDYAEATLPETPVVESWGGRVVLLPYLPGRSTTSILGRTRSDPRFASRPTLPFRSADHRADHRADQREEP